MEQKKFYEKPQTEVVEMKYEGMLCVSGGNQGGNTQNPAPEMDEPTW